MYVQIEQYELAIAQIDDAITTLVSHLIAFNERETVDAMFTYTALALAIAHAKVMDDAS